MRLFSFGELWCGDGFNCDTCGKITNTVVLSNDENNSLPGEGGSEAASYIISKKLGKNRCWGCAIQEATP